MKRNESTSKRIAAIAGRVLAHNAERNTNIALLPIRQAQINLAWADIRALAASCLTQSPDKTSQRTSPPRSLTARRPQAKKPATSSKPKRGKNAKIGPWIQARPLKKGTRT